MSFYKVTKEGISLSVRLQPKSSKNEIVGIYQDALKIKITAPPVEGEANAEAMRFLSKTFNIPKSSVILKQGDKSKNKVFLLKGVTEEVLRKITHP